MAHARNMADDFHNCLGIPTQVDLIAEGICFHIALPAISAICGDRSLYYILALFKSRDQLLCHDALSLCAHQVGGRGFCFDIVIVVRNQSCGKHYL